MRYSDRFAFFYEKYQLTVLTNAAVRKAITLLGKYGINIASESSEEGLQQSVSYANLDRVQRGDYDPNANGFERVWDLIAGSGNTLGDAVTGRDTTARDQILDAMGQGAKLAALFGGPTAVAFDLVTNPIQQTSSQTTVKPVQSPTERDIINTTQLWTQQLNEAAGIQPDEVQVVNIDDVDGSSQQESEHGAIVTAFNIDEIRPQLKTESNTAFFWSGNTDGVGGAKVAADIASTKNGVTLESLIDSKGISMPIWDLSDQSSVKAWDMASAAYAEQVVGEVRAIVGAKLRPGNIWENVELPRLKANPNVTRIIIIDPKTGIETTIFER